MQELSTLQAAREQLHTAVRQNTEALLKIMEQREQEMLQTGEDKTQLSPENGLTPGLSGWHTPLPVPFPFIEPVIQHGLQ
jgi:hypothetical protein